jgi:hypothetical protein
LRVGPWARLRHWTNSVKRRAMMADTPSLAVWAADNRSGLLARGLARNACSPIHRMPVPMLRYRLRCRSGWKAG